MVNRMKGVTAAIVIAGILAALFGFSKNGNQQSAAQPATVGIPTDELNWVEEPWGGRTASVWGDPKIGPSGIFIDHPAGFNMPEMIIHTANLRAIIVKGWMKIWREGQTAEDVPKLTAGSYFFKPGGVQHQELFSPDEPTLVYVVYEGPRDTIINGKSMPLE